MKMFSYSIDVAFHHHIFPSQVWARGSQVTTNGYGIAY
jgi:hypothetical protein